MKKFNYSKIFLLGFGFFGVSVIWIVYDAFVPLFLANKFNLAPWLIGLFMTFDNIAALLFNRRWEPGQTACARPSDAPAIHPDRGSGWCNCLRLIPIAAILPLFVACTSTLLLSMAFWRTPVVALMPDITPSRFRSQANGIIYMMGGIGAITASLVGSTLYEINVAFPFWMGSVLVILASLLVFIFIKEPKQFEEGEKQPNMFQTSRK